MKKTPILRVYESKGQWYWTLYARNGLKVADGCEGYVRRYNAIRAAYRTRNLMAQAEIVVEDPPK